jgi:hypothetical protein
MSRSRPKRLPPGARLRITTSAPVVIVRGPRSPDVFSYTDAQWVKVVAAHPACNQHQLLVELEAAGQRYWASRRDPQLQKRLQRGLKQARAHVVLARDAQFPPEIGALAGAVAVIEAKLGGRAALIREAFAAWTRATGDAELKYSRRGEAPWAPVGPLIRFLAAALSPILGRDMVRHEMLVKMIQSERTLRKSS